MALTEKLRVLASRWGVDVSAPQVWRNALEEFRASEVMAWQLRRKLIEHSRTLPVPVSLARAFDVYRANVYVTAVAIYHFVVSDVGVPASLVPKPVKVPGLPVGTSRSSSLGPGGAFGRIAVPDSPAGLAALGRPIPGTTGSFGAVLAISASLAAVLLALAAAGVIIAIWLSWPTIMDHWARIRVVSAQRDAVEAAERLYGQYVRARQAGTALEPPSVPIPRLPDSSDSLVSDASDVLKWGTIAVVSVSAAYLVYHVAKAVRRE